MKDTSDYIRVVLTLSAFLLAWVPRADADDSERGTRETSIRAGNGRTIVKVHEGTRKSLPPGGVASSQYAFPRPPLAGFSPLVAITTSNKGNPLGSDMEFEHDLQSSYVGSSLNPSADPSFVVGYLDSGSDVNLAAGSYADTLGLFGSNLTENTIQIGGVGGQVPAYITMPVGFFAAGLSAVDGYGMLDYGALVGHSNVCGLAAPPIECGNGEALTAVIGMPFLAFYNSVIRVDMPQRVNVGGVTYAAPDVQIQRPIEPLPTFAHRISMTFYGLSPVVTTASYFPEFEYFETPIFPTLLSLVAGTIPTGGSFFATVLVLEGEPGPTNPAQPIELLVDTGAQSSIISEGVAASLSLPFEPDFIVDVCGVGGLVENVPGYYVDYVKMNAQGGALEFSQAPFVVLDLPSATGGTLDGILGMNFFWNRNVIFQPALGSSGFLHASAPVSFAYGDFDKDFDVDAQDVGMFAYCLTGPGVQMVSPECTHVDADDDGDVDLMDYIVFEACFSGSDIPADPNCG